MALTASRPKGEQRSSWMRSNEQYGVNDGSCDPDASAPRYRYLVTASLRIDTADAVESTPDRFRSAATAIDKISASIAGADCRAGPAGDVAAIRTHRVRPAAGQGGRVAELGRFTRLAAGLG